MKRRGFLGACLAAVVAPYVPTPVAAHEQVMLKVTEAVFKVGDFFTISGVVDMHGVNKVFRITGESISRNEYVILPAILGVPT